MLYSHILVDVFNLYYRRLNKALTKDPIDLANNLISFIEGDISKHLDKEGVLYLLYDPIPKKDLGLSNSFKTERQQIVKSYKANRNHDKNVLEVVDLVRKYFLHKGPKIATVISNSLEADDFVEGIVTKYPADTQIALYSNDEDWCRYISDSIHLINEGFENPFTAQSFKDKYNFKPNSSSVCFFKAFFGDPSDNIEGALMVKRLQNANDYKKLAFQWIQEIGEKSDYFDVVCSRVKKYTFIELNKLKELNTEQELFMKINCIPPKKGVTSQLWDNVNIIKCRCSNVDKYITTKEPDPKYDKLIEATLGRGTQKKTFKFGHIKAK